MAASVRDLLGERLILKRGPARARFSRSTWLRATSPSADFAGMSRIEHPHHQGVRARRRRHHVPISSRRGRSSLGELADITPDDFAIEHDFCLIWQREASMRHAIAPSATWRTLM